MRILIETNGRNGGKSVIECLHAVVELLSDGRDVHWGLDDLLVSWELLGVDGLQEGPRFIVTSEL